ncbi:hypothetical protein ZIOFF_075764 [Zingiber officinale]|uniref:Uncharacterized protein n=1 Tax=Zingiber officinale TaxID=94328 RepID=A0A8J5EKP3_ZINOF|nr:hypothetical protein ZIOFF_075764 [Zingiber officinale]
MEESTWKEASCQYKIKEVRKEEGWLRFVSTAAKKKKNPWLDPFDCGEDPDIEYGSLFADGKQEEDPRPPDNPYDFLKFPMGSNVELALLASKVRGDVRLCCCVISGRVYENLLFFPVIQLIKDRYPGVQIDNRYYDLILSTKLAGLGHAAFLFMTSARDKVSYVYPNVNAAGTGLLLTETFTSPTMNLSERGYHMYDEMEEWHRLKFMSNVFFFSIALFSSEEKENTFVPNAREKRCSIIASSTGKLIDIDVESVKNAVGIFEGCKVLINF